VLRTSVFPPLTLRIGLGRTPVSHAGAARGANEAKQTARPGRPGDSPPARLRRLPKSAPRVVAALRAPAPSRRDATQTRLSVHDTAAHPVAPCSRGGKEVRSDGGAIGGARGTNRLEPVLVRAVRRIEAVRPHRDRVLCWQACNRVRGVTAVPPTRCAAGKVRIADRRWRRSPTILFVNHETQGPPAGF
jgi:hypothetical protein